MSLIYSALNKLEQEQGATGAQDPSVGNPYAVAARKSGTPRWVYLVIAGCVVVVLGGWLSMNALRAKFAAAQMVQPISQVVPASQAAPTSQLAMAPVVVAPVSVSAVVDLPMSAPVVPVMTPVSALASLPEPQALQAAAPAAQAMAAPVKTAQIKPPARARPRPPVEMITEAAPPPPLDPQETERLTKAVKLAIQTGKHDDAQGLLKQLATRLPAESITLLRLNAWHRMQSGDSAQAMVLYRQITERLPSDESAGINLALLHWKAGQQGEARQLIGALAERHPESETVQKYSRELGAPR